MIVRLRFRIAQRLGEISREEQLLAHWIYVLVVSTREIGVEK